MTKTVRLYNCKTSDEQIAWAVTHLKRGGRVYDIGLWLGGVDRPMQLIRDTKIALRAEGWVVTKALEPVRDAANEEHMMLCWRARNGRSVE